MSYDDYGMKKLIATTTGILAPLALTAQAFAQGAINPCPTGANFGSVCSLKGADFGKVVGNIIQILMVLAVVIAVIFLIWGGIKWILSGGDKAKVESARNTIIGGIIGLVLVFLAYFIISVVASLFGIEITNMSLPKF